MDVESLAKQLILKGMTDEQQAAILTSIKGTMAQARTVQKQRVGENVQLVVQALKKLEADIRDRYDDLGHKIEQRVVAIKDGQDGRNGIDGRAGKDGRTGRDGGSGARGNDGLSGRHGLDGVNGVSVTNAFIDFDGSLIINLSSGQILNVGEVVAPELAEKIKVITNGGGTSQVVTDTLASLQAQINAIGSLTYAGTWNASTNSPVLASGVGTKGYYYVVSVTGSTNLNGVTDWVVGDWAIFNGTAWQKLDQTNLVSSVNGQVGAVSLSTSDIGEGTNLYYLNSRARAAISAGTGLSYNSTTGVITNSAPDQTVSLTGGAGISTSGTYPNFIVTNSAPDQTVALTGGGTTSITGTYPNFTITSTGGSVTSVSGTAPVVSSGGATPAISLAANYGDTQNPFASKTANFVLAAPTGTAGVPTFRAVVATDIPTLNQNTTGTAANVTGVVAVANGGLGVATLTANNVILGNGTSPPQAVAPSTSGNVLTSNGTTWVSSVPMAGGLSYIYTTGAVTAANNQGVLTSTAAGAFTVTLPITPAVGAQVVVADAGGAWGTNNLIVGRNGSTISGLAENLVCDITGASVQFVYDGTTWEVYTQVGGNSGSAGATTGISYTRYTANITVVDKQGVIADTTAGAFTVTLPASPVVGNQVVIVDGNNWGTNNLNVGRNGSTIEDIAQDLSLDIQGASVTLIYDGTTWEVYAQIGGNGGTAATLTGTQTLTNKTIDIASNTLTGVASKGANTFTAAQEFATGASIASAATVNLDTATGNRVHITGTTTITAWTLTRGPRTVIFDGACQLTYSTTTNRLNSGATNYTTATGDIAVIESDGTTVFVNITKVAGTSVIAAAAGFTLGTPVATTSGTSIDFTGIPAGTKQIVISFNGVSTNGASTKLIQIGNSGGVSATAYQSAGSKLIGTVATTGVTSGFVINSIDATYNIVGSVILTLENSATFTWAAAGVTGAIGGADTYTTAGIKSLTSVLTSVRITTSNGTDAFDAGEINIAYL